MGKCIAQLKKLKKKLIREKKSVPYNPGWFWSFCLQLPSWDLGCIPASPVYITASLALLTHNSLLSARIISLELELALTLTEIIGLMPSSTLVPTSALFGVLDNDHLHSPSSVIMKYFKSSRQVRTRAEIKKIQRASDGSQWHALITKVKHLRIPQSYFWERPLGTCIYKVNRCAGGMWGVKVFPWRVFDSTDEPEESNQKWL